MVQTATRKPGGRRRAAYELGHHTTRFRGIARLTWELADGGQPLPGHLAGSVAVIEQSSDELLRSVRGGGREVAEQERTRLVAAARTAVELLRGGWNAEEHCAGISYRDRANDLLSFLPGDCHEDIDPSKRLSQVGVFTDSCWGALEEALVSFAARLPNSLTPWFDLGRGTALAYDEYLSEPELAKRLDRLQTRLAETEKDPVLSTLRLDVSPRTMHLAGGQHEWWSWVRSQVWQLHQDVEKALIPGNSAAIVSNNARGGEMSLETQIALVLGLLVMNPDMTLVDAAETAGVNRTTCYRYQIIKTTLDSRKLAQQGERLRGQYTRGRAGDRQLDGVQDDETD